MNMFSRKTRTFKKYPNFLRGHWADGNYSSTTNIKDKLRSRFHLELDSWQLNCSCSGNCAMGMNPRLSHSVLKLKPLKFIWVVVFVTSTNKSPGIPGPVRLERFPRLELGIGKTDKIAAKSVENIENLAQRGFVYDRLYRGAPILA